MNEAIAVDVIDEGGRTPEQKEAIQRIGQQVANALADVHDPYVLMDILIGAVISAALNTGGDEDFIGVMVACTMKTLPIFKANRDARGSGFRQ